MRTLLRSRRLLLALCALFWLALACAWVFQSETAHVAFRTAVRLENGTLRTRTIALDPMTDAIRVRLRRPTSAHPLAWDSSSRVRVTLVVTKDGRRYEFKGFASGGVRQSPGGRDAQYYTLTAIPSWGFFGRRSGSTQRLGQGATVYTAHVDLDVLTGSLDTELDVTTTVAPAPLVAFHNSVAYDTSTVAVEENGDGVLSLSHAGGSGSDRAAFAGTGGQGIGSGPATTSITYAGNVMTEMWDLTTDVASNCYNSGYQLAGANVTAGTQTVTATVAAAPSSQFLQAITMTGVDSGTPVGTHQTTGPSGSPWTVTVGSVGTDDLVVDQLVAFGGDGIIEPVIGADQTQRNASENADGTTFLRGSTQLGSLGGVMSWTMSSSIDGFLGAVAFKAAGGAPTPTGRLLLLGVGGEQ